MTDTLREKVFKALPTVPEVFVDKIIDIALEEAARVAQGDEAGATPYYRGRVHAADAIRALKDKP